MAGNSKKTTQTQLFMRHLQFHGYLCISPFLLSYNKFPLNPYNLVPGRLFVSLVALCLEAGPGVFPPSLFQRYSSQNCDVTLGNARPS